MCALRILDFMRTIRAPRFVVLVRGGKYPPREAGMNNELNSTYWATEDVYDPCDHGVNAAVDTCPDCEADIAWIRIVDGVVHYSDRKL